MTAKKFEELTKSILNSYGYTSINPIDRIDGRGTSHQIDAIGIVKITPPFCYPITLLAECKYYNGNRSIGIEIVRNFFGVMEDIKQNIPNEYLMPSIVQDKYINGTSNIVGMILSTAAFSKYSKQFAYAHGIFLVTLGRLKSNHTHYFANFAGNLVVVQIPNKLKVEDDIVSIIEKTLNHKDKVWEINGILNLIDELEYSSNKKGEEGEKSYCYLYEIEIKGLKSTFRTITHEKILKDTFLTLEMPKGKHYVTIRVQKVRNS